MQQLQFRFVKLYLLLFWVQIHFNYIFVNNERTVLRLQPNRSIVLAVGPVYI